MKIKPKKSSTHQCQEKETNLVFFKINFYLDLIWLEKLIFY